ncbi:MAG: Asp23/Gls24 family envelope stress response protein, partial [Bacillota bacterium]|nr:Asp23/Gls24 family envelope stress response protein [Bacillota bacterium]
INISDHVIAIIAGIAATECYGLVGMASRSFQDGLAELLGRESMHKGVDVRLSGERMEIDLYIVVEYGINIPEVAYNVMEKVKYTVERLVGVEVSRINVHVQGVRVTLPGRK